MVIFKDPKNVILYTAVLSDRANETKKDETYQNPIEKSYMDILKNLNLKAIQSKPLNIDYTFWDYNEYLKVGKRLGIDGIHFTRLTKKNSIPVTIHISLESDFELLRSQEPAICMSIKNRYRNYNGRKDL